MLFRQLLDHETCTYTYLIADVTTKAAILVDPVKEQVDRDRVLTGDSLLIRGCGGTDFQSGDAGRLFNYITKKLFSLPDQTLVYPGHDYRGHTQSTIGEERQWNPRLANRDRASFIELMNNLNLPDPQKIMEAVPANERCGKVAVKGS